MAYNMHTIANLNDCGYREKRICNTLYINYLYEIIGLDKESHSSTLCTESLEGISCFTQMIALRIFGRS